MLQCWENKTHATPLSNLRTISQRNHAIPIHPQPPPHTGIGLITNTLRLGYIDNFFAAPIPPLRTTAFINAVVAESPPLPPRPSNEQNTSENHTHKKDSSSYLGRISTTLSPHPSSPILSPPPETSHREQGRLSAGMKASILPQPPSLEITNSTYNLIWRVVSARI